MDNKLWVKCVAHTLAYEPRAIDIFNILVNRPHWKIIETLPSLPDTLGARELFGRLYENNGFASYNLQLANIKTSSKLTPEEEKSSMQVLQQFIDANPHFDIWATLTHQKKDPRYPSNKKNLNLYNLHEHFYSSFAEYYITHLINTVGKDAVRAIFNIQHDDVHGHASMDAIVENLYKIDKDLNNVTEYLHEAMKLPSKEDSETWLRAYYADLVNNVNIPTTPFFNARFTALSILFEMALKLQSGPGSIQPIPTVTPIPAWVGNIKRNELAANINRIVDTKYTFYLPVGITPNLSMALEQLYTMILSDVVAEQTTKEKLAEQEQFLTQLQQWLSDQKIDVKPCNTA